jgi:hypothetical protein
MSILSTILAAIGIAAVIGSIVAFITVNLLKKK